MPILTAFDVVGVQDYVFATNRLKAAIGASHLVSWATSPEGALARIGLSQPLVAAGGNAIVEFADRAAARDAAARYSRLLYDDAPGLDVAIAHHPYEPGNLAGALKQLQTVLARVKIERVPSAPLDGLGVTATCRQTGGPASGFARDDPTTPLSRAALAMAHAADQGEHGLSFLSGCRPPDGFRLAFPQRIDEMGRTRHDTSLLGVVHIDGNRMGSKIGAWLTGCVENETPDATVREQYHEWSEALNALAADAMRAVVRRAAAAVVLDPVNGPPRAATVDAHARRPGERDSDQEQRSAAADGTLARLVGSDPARAFALVVRDRTIFLPVRPVLVSGDDLTFICDGRLALDLAATALAAFEREVPHLGAVHACAGVAIGRTHAPFSRAYDLAAGLCESAKRYVRRQSRDLSALDWHVDTPTPGQSVADLRRRHYRVNGDKHGAGRALTCRPYPLGQSSGDPGSWRWLDARLLGDGADGLRGPFWAGRRSKVIALAEVARDGGPAVKRQLETWHIVDTQLALPIPAADGYLDRGTPLLDAVELLDLHQSLAGAEARRGREEDVA